MAFPQGKNLDSPGWRRLGDASRGQHAQPNRPTPQASNLNHYKDLFGRIGLRIQSPDSSNSGGSPARRAGRPRSMDVALAEGD
jgi:hypothetical protein